MSARFNVRFDHWFNEPVEQCRVHEPEHHDDREHHNLGAATGGKDQLAKLRRLFRARFWVGAKVRLPLVIAHAANIGAPPVLRKMGVA